MSDDMEQNVVEILEPSALQAIETAQVNQQIATAKRYPRPTLSVIKQRIIDRATIDKETAESCFYTLKRKDKDGNVKTIQGKSVGLARIVISSYGNLRAGARIIDEGERAVRSQGVCMDLESNVAVSVEVSRRITGSNGRRYSDDMINQTMAAAVSIALRNAVFNVIPDALSKPAYDACRKVALGEAKSIVIKFDEMVHVFSTTFKLEGARAKLLAWCGRQSVDEMTWEDAMDLLGLQNAIRGNETTIEEQFPPSLGAKSPLFKKQHDADDAANTKPVSPEGGNLFDNPKPDAVLQDPKGKK